MVTVLSANSSGSDKIRPRVKVSDGVISAPNFRGEEAAAPVAVATAGVRGVSSWVAGGGGDAAEWQPATVANARATAHAEGNEDRRIGPYYS